MCVEHHKQALMNGSFMGKDKQNYQYDAASQNAARLAAMKFHAQAAKAYGAQMSQEEQEIQAFEAQEAAEDELRNYIEDVQGADDVKPPEVLAPVSYTHLTLPTKA